MHKITKGLKKKKKGKKSKRKDEELFKPEELEAYRREHQTAADETQPTAQNEEWKKFIQLTSGVDDILKKTQGDLDRIKSTSFFQRIPPPSEVKKQEEEEQQQKQKATEQEQEEGACAQQQEASLGIVQVSESESDEEDDDDIFDTAYIDVIATGEVKLAYIPESPTDQPDGDDPFDTSYAERAILGPAVDKRGKKLVPLGAAVEVLTGRAQLPTCATQRPPSRRRQIQQERDLLGNFDDNANSIPVASSGSPVEVQKTLLDDDSIPLPDEPIDLSKTLHQIPIPDSTKDILEQFDVIKVEEDEDDKEFEALAAESLSKSIPIANDLPIPIPTTVTVNSSDIVFEAFADEQIKSEEDPFDTTFAENILPGKAELKLIEKEILEDSSDFDPRATESVLNTVSINITYPCGQKEAVTYSERVSEEELHTIKPNHRDLLGGSNTDLSNLSDHPLQPVEKLDDNYIEYCDPFDTSIVDIAKQPGQTELKFLERELLADIIEPVKKSSLSDDDFDPRAIERERTISRPDVLNITSIKSVSFDLPSPEKDLLGGPNDHKTIKPLTPFYVRKSSIPEPSILPEVAEDPFDTSFVTESAPGKAELKIIESELFDPTLNTVVDQDFDPRDEKKVVLAKVKDAIKEIENNPKSDSKPVIDLLSADTDIAVKVLTPATQIEAISYSDPFDTSAASNIVPGKTELKILESELLNDLDDQLFDPRGEQQDLLVHSGDIIIEKPLTPIPGGVSILPEVVEDIDPFDTSIANNIQPGKTELKLLESELITN